MRPDSGDRFDGSSCQQVSSPAPGSEPCFWYVHRRARNAVRRIRRLVGLRVQRDSAAVIGRSATDVTNPPIAVGDRVRVRPLAEIRCTLDAQGRCRGCAFLDSMTRYCEREFRVVKRVDRFFDEARWRMLKCNNVVLLEGVYCDGSGHPDTQRCDRMCFFFWRTEWLERLD